MLLDVSLTVAKRVIPANECGSVQILDDGEPLRSGGASSAAVPPGECLRSLLHGEVGAAV